MNTVYLGLGSNLGDRLFFLQQAVVGLDSTPENKISRASSLYETKPVGVSSPQPPYYNAVLELQTSLSPMELLQLTKNIEHKMGREQKGMRDSRYLDIDLLLFGNVIMNTPVLKLPHPLLEHRWFVLVPLNELCPDLTPPGFQLTVNELLKRLGLPQGVLHLFHEHEWIKTN